VPSRRSVDARLVTRVIAMVATSAVLAAALAGALVVPPL
jgi:hypothetical protein